MLFRSNINDSHGHAAGDEVLRSFARTLRPLIRPADVLGRYGGEEFLIVCGGGTSLEGARTLAERIRQAVETMVVPGLPSGFRVTVSVGVAEFLAGESPEELLVRADRALYAAKQAGRNRVVAAPQPMVEPSAPPAMVQPDLSASERRAAPWGPPTPSQA